MTASDTRRRCALAAVAAFAFAFAVAPANAQTSAERDALDLFERGRGLARDGRCAEAIPLLRESIRRLEGTGALLNLGHCHETMGKLASAHRAFLRAAEVARARDDTARAEEAERRAAAVAKEVSTLVVHVPAAASRTGLSLRLDDAPLARELWGEPAPVDAGPHELTIVEPPSAPRTLSLSVGGAGARLEVAVPEPAAVPPPPVASARFIGLRPDGGALPARAAPLQRTAGIAGGAVGAAGLVAGTVFGLIAIDAHASARDACPGYPVCPSSSRATVDDRNERASTSGTISTVAFVAGAALLVGGVVLLLTAPPASRATSRQ